MSRRASRLAALTTVAALATTTAFGLGPLAPAHADDSLPPVTTDDDVTIQARSSQEGAVSFVDVLANDRSATGDPLEICRVSAPPRGLSVAEVAPSGDFLIHTPHGGFGTGGGTAEEGAREQLALLPWANRAGTYRLTYWACDTEHLTPATVTVTVRKVPEVTVRKAERPGRLRFTNPRATRAVVVYGGLRQDTPDGRLGLAPRSSQTRRVPYRAVRWMAFSPRTGAPISEGIVRGVQLPDPASGSGGGVGGAEPRFTARMLRAWRHA